MPDSFVTPWIVACEAPLSMGLLRQEYWSELPYPSPRGLPNSGIEPVSLALAGGFFITEPPEKFHPMLMLMHNTSLENSWQYYTSLSIYTSDCISSVLLIILHHVSSHDEFLIHISPNQ